MNDLPGAIENLAKRVAAMELRVDALEHSLAAPCPPPKHESEKAPIDSAAATATVAVPGSLFPVLGKSLLGIAGAYALRAMEETGALPKFAIASAGILYAFLWLVWAARTRSGPRFAATVYTSTSALILAPMLWELTLRFGVLAPQIAAAVVCAYALAAVALAWSRNLASLVRVVWIACIALALALAFVSHEFHPFIAVLLILTAVSEFVPAFDRMADTRVMVALAADAALWILIFVYFSPQRANESYPPLARGALLAPGVAFFLLFAASVTYRTVLLAHPITIYATIQTTISFLLAAVSLADFGPANSTMILGISCLVFSAAICVELFTILRRNSVQRNVNVFSTWAAALLIAGSFLCIPPLWSTFVLGSCAVAALVQGRKKAGFAFEIYGTLFLFASAFASGHFGFLADVLIGTPAGFPTSGVWLITLCSALCYVTVMPREGEPWGPRVVHLLLAALLAGSLVALFAQQLLTLIAMKTVLGAHHLALIRTLALCVAALMLAFSGSRWHRVELTRLGYAALALVAVKLLFEDMRHGHLAYSAASVCLVALTLIAAPRLARERWRA